MLPDYHNSSDLLIDISKNSLYSKLIIQLNKDFGLVNLDINLPENSTPSLIKEELKKVVKNLILTDLNNYKNLLYIIDFHEVMTFKKEASNIDIYTESIVFLILKRVWKKVWFKANYYT